MKEDMPKVSKDRDDVMAQSGYLRAAVIATLFGVKTSTVIRWPEASATNDKTTIKNVQANGLNWLDWSDVRRFRKTEADIRKLPLNAYNALLDARAKYT